MFGLKDAGNSMSVLRTRHIYGVRGGIPEFRAQVWMSFDT